MIKIEHIVESSPEDAGFTDRDMAIVTALVDAFLGNKVGLIRGKDADGNPLAILCIVDRQPDGVDALKIIGPLLGALSHGFSPVKPADSTDEIMMVQIPELAAFMESRKEGSSIDDFISEVEKFNKVGSSH